ncbi:MAG: DUF1559 domain-containing protein, partial [Gemmataceae bacterium]|nr:DUF1559 domain-containing protein [Gemmata sp.]MDW8199164.1 DUF1559 domain-containing protein [Gemmataceae bacterium]
MLNPLPSRHRMQCGFTLIELLVVIAIIAVLVGLLLPAVQKVRYAAARSQAQNNLKQLALACHGYHDANRFLPFNGNRDAIATNNESGSWVYQILPFIEQQAIYDTANGIIPTTWNARIPTLLCPIRSRPGFVSGVVNQSQCGPTQFPFQVNPGETWYPPAGWCTIAGGGTHGVVNGQFGVTNNTNAVTTGWYMMRSNVTIVASGPITDYGINPFINNTSGQLDAASTRRTLLSITDGTSNTILLGQMYSG